MNEADSTMDTSIFLFQDPINAKEHSDMSRKQSLLGADTEWMKDMLCVAILSGVCPGCANYLAVHVAMANMTNFDIRKLLPRKHTGKGRARGFPESPYDVQKSLRNFIFIKKLFTFFEIIVKN